MPRVTLSITEEEREALVSLARKERRDPRAQAAIEIRHALERAGYLAPSTAPAMDKYNPVGYETGLVT